MMKLTIVRHAAAIERTVGGSEERRYLTPEGREFFRKTARTMLKKGARPDLILTSPLLRAVQTADILAETLEYAGPLQAVDELSPGFDLPSFRRLVATYHGAGDLVLVGHEPDLSTLVATLLTLPAGFAFRKGGAVRLKLDPADPQGTAAFKWMAVGGKLITSREEAFAR